MSGTLTELPIGRGAGGRKWRDDDLGDEPELDLEGDEPAPFGPPAPAPAALVEVPRVELVSWDEKKLRKPLRLIGKTVNWQIRRRLQLDTDAGLMTDENLSDIGEPLAEIGNRYEPTRALAARSVELNLVLAIYEYVQETAVKAGRSKQMEIDFERAAASARAGVEQPPHLAVDEFEGGTQL